MDRVAVFVDTGYLVAATATLFDSYRAALAIRHAELIPELLREATEQAGVPPLRLLWYDGAFNAVPFGEQHTVRLLPDVKLRLGILVKHGGRIEQKGVDSLLQRDLTVLARNGAISDAILLGGDEDLRRGVEEAPEHGVRVHLWGVAAGEGRYRGGGDRPRPVVHRPLRTRASLTGRRIDRGASAQGLPRSGRR